MKWNLYINQNRWSRTTNQWNGDMSYGEFSKTIRIKISLKYDTSQEAKAD